MMAYAYNSRTREVETGGSLGLTTSLSILTGEPQRKIKINKVDSMSKDDA